MTKPHMPSADIKEERTDVTKASGKGVVALGMEASWRVMPPLPHLRKQGQCAAGGESGHPVHRGPVRRVLVPAHR